MIERRGGGQGIGQKSHKVGERRRRRTAEAVDEVAQEDPGWPDADFDDSPAERAASSAEDGAAEEGPDEAALAEAKALSLLANREHTRAELQRKLGRRGFSPAAIDAAIDALAERGWQSDTRFAEQFIRSRSAGGVGPRKLRAQLAQRGVAGDPFEVLDPAETPDWVSLAQQSLRKRFLSGADYAKMRGFLERRGFTAAQARAAIAAFEAGDDDRE